MAINLIGETLEALAGVSDPSAARDCLMSALQGYGLTHSAALSHAVFLGGTGQVFECDYPEQWQKRFIDRSYALEDPVIRQIERRAGAFAWSSPRDFYEIDQKGEQILAEGAAFGLSKGLVVPCDISGQGKSSVTCIFADEVPKVENAALVAFLMALYFEKLVDLETNRTGLDKPKNIGLSKRQIQCLELIAMGYDTWNVSKLLSISEATVKTHTKRALALLGANNRAHGVAKAISMGLIRGFGY